jgi:hypothetical protein
MLVIFARSSQFCKRENVQVFSRSMDLTSRKRRGTQTEMVCLNSTQPWTPLAQQANCDDRPLSLHDETLLKHAKLNATTTTLWYVTHAILAVGPGISPLTCGAKRLGRISKKKKKKKLNSMV